MRCWVSVSPRCINICVGRCDVATTKNAGRRLWKERGSLYSINLATRKKTIFTPALVVALQMGGRKRLKLRHPLAKPPRHLLVAVHYLLAIHLYKSYPFSLYAIPPVRPFFPYLLSFSVVAILFYWQPLTS